MDAKASSEALRNAWHAYLRQHAWSHLIHLTTRFPYTREQLEAEVRNRLIRRLARPAQHRIPWFAAFERTTEDHWHAHVLVAATESLSHRQFQRAWDAGFCHIDKIEDPDTAIGYTVKTLGEQPDNYALSGRWLRLPPQSPRLAA